MRTLAPEELRAILGDGLSAADPADLATALGSSTEDQELARRLVAELSKDVAANVAVRPERRSDPRPKAATKSRSAPDSSFLGRLAVAGRSNDDVASLENVKTLVAVARAGSFLQRRAAVLRLSELLQSKRVAREEQRLAVSFLSSHREVALTYELADARANLGGRAGREARAEKDELEELSEFLRRDVARFWDGQLSDEPVTALRSDQRALLFVRVRDLEDPVVAHLGSLLEGGDEVLRDRERFDLLTSLRYSGDPRLVATFGTLLKRAEPTSVVEAARALGTIEDPRARHLLRRAYDRNADARQKTVLAGALGLLGDYTGAGYVRSVLGSDDTEVLQNGLEALASLGGVEDVDLAAPLLEHGDLRVRTAAVIALGRIGAARALTEVTQFRADASGDVRLVAELEDAEAAIRARLELRGEAEETNTFTPVRYRESAEDAIEAPVFRRLRGWWVYLVGLLWLFVGAEKRAVRRFEAAAATRPGWVIPFVTVGMTHARRDRHALALSSFRRAVDLDRSQVEDRFLTMRALTTSFLRRAEELEQDGRDDIARGLLEEVLSLDLRRAPGPIRFELSRRRDAMRRRSAA